MNQELYDFFAYLQPIINGCSGFIKTDGYMTYFPGTLIIMDPEEMYCAIFRLPVNYNFYVTAKINTFLSLKSPEQQSLEALYFLGNSLKAQRMIDYYQLYSNIDSICNQVYYEPDCFNLNHFKENVEKSTIGNICLMVNSQCYRFPVSKAITVLNKGDSASLTIYDYICNPTHPQIKTSKYSVYKKKLKLTFDIFSNILLA